MLELRVLGTPQAILDSAGLALRPRRLALLTVLALDGPQTRSALAGLLFERLDLDAARSRVRMEVHRLVHGPLGSALRLDGDLIHVAADCDGPRFEAALEAGDIDTAMALYRGPLLEGLDLGDTPVLDDWLTTSRTRLLTRFTSALDAQLLRLDAQGEAEAALQVARTLQFHHPLSETYSDALVARLVTLGRRGEARQVQIQFRARFERTLGFTPQGLPIPNPAVTASPDARPGLERPPLVGREALWFRLDQWAAGPGGVAVLVGEPGVGKSRLAHEWAAAQGAPLLTLRAEESSVDLAYAPLEMVLRGRRAEWVATGTRWATDLAWLLPELTGTSPGEDEPSLGALRQLGVLTRALHFLVGAGGVLLLDDAQWCDGATLAVVRQFLSRHLDEGPRVLVTVRPGEDEARPALAAWQRDLDRAGLLTTLDVPPLGEVAVLKMLRLLSGSEQITPLARHLARVSGGNPYALLSLLRGLIEEGHLGTDAQGRWATPEQLATRLPRSAADALLRQIERTPVAVRRLLEAAALHGSSFDFEAAWAGSDLNEETALQALEQALRERTVWTEPPHYRFAHDLLRQAVAGSLSPTRAGRVHRRLAEHLTLVGAPAATLGLHWQGAGVRSEAGRCWGRAAEEADRLHAHREAVSALTHALDCTDDPQARFGLRLTQMRHLKALGDLVHWAEVLETAERELPPSPSGREDQVLHLALERTHLLWRTGQNEAALAYSAAFVDGATHPARAALLHDRAGVLIDLERHAEAQLALEQAWLHVDDPAGPVAANLHNTQAQTADALGQLHQGLAHAEQAVRLFQALGIWTGVASACATSSFLYRSQEDLLAARSALEQGLDAARRAQHLPLQLGSLNLLCEVLLGEGDWSSGLECATAGIELCEQEELQDGLATFEDWLGRFKAIRVPGV